MSALPDAKSADQLFAYLDDRGIKYSWLAGQLNISIGYLTHIKAGRRPVPEWLPAAAAAALGVPQFLLFPVQPMDEEPAHV